MLLHCTMQTGWWCWPRLGPARRWLMVTATVIGYQSIAADHTGTAQDFAAVCFAA